MMKLLILCFFSSTCTLHSTEAAFTFVLKIISHSTSGNCDTFFNPSCETYFSLFCLRESRTDTSTNTNDCPLGEDRNRFTHQSGRISIHSLAQWRESFQLFIQAWDNDDTSGNDHLDDIFVEGSLTSSAWSSAIIVTGLNRRVSVRVQYKRSCDANYYGVSCSNYCECADDDIKGHFTCNFYDGSKICLRGYSNPDNNCKNNTDDCASGPCHNGNCTDLVADFVCACLPGYTGKTCSENIDECKDAPCLGNSTCIDYVNSFTCICNHGYTGEKCNEELEPCESDPCSSGGSCVMLDSFNFMCVCLAGYTGPQCEFNIDECLTANCPQQRSGSTSNSLVVGLVLAAVVVLCCGCISLCSLILVFGRRQKKSESVSEYMKFNTPYDRLGSVMPAHLYPLNGSMHVSDNSLYALRDNEVNKENTTETQFGSDNSIYEEPVSNVLCSKHSKKRLNTTFPSEKLMTFPDKDVTPLEVSVTPAGCVVPTHHTFSSKNFQHYETATNAYESTDDDHFDNIGSLPTSSARKVPYTPFSQGIEYSYDQLHHK